MPVSERPGTEVLIRQAKREDVRLTLEAEGLKDTRTGVFIPWAAFRGARLTTSGSLWFLEVATLYVSLAGEEGEREVGIDVRGLDRSPEVIVRLVHDQGIAVLRQHRTSRTPGTP